MAAAAAAAASVCGQLRGDERLAPVVTSFSWHPWKLDTSTCLEIQLLYRGLSEIKFSEIHDIELANWSLIHECRLLDVGRFGAGTIIEAIYWACCSN
ncbi:uncharacterized protein LOC116258429 isoform X2 [Nymphaea colorata]|uniref:uncharacterized protein LOC116258429 isoform X2 n=1 Tax=Nymphaea colorata TaxID=210225 RepID=UPI00129EB1E1|nr:uncharacterized protein LOC116258429 isoform X2 [Nymphaea colorata]